MTPDEFRKLVGDMRRAQKTYFRHRDQRSLEESKQLERQVDAELADTGQKQLFGESK